MKWVILYVVLLVAMNKSVAIIYNNISWCLDEILNYTIFGSALPLFELCVYLFLNLLYRAAACNCRAHFVESQPLSQSI